tara:strand:- start:1573 stop:2481 length:909 start_codon:yes stop_codon:yes gene_type:complete
VSPAYILLYHGVTDAESIGIENFSRKHMCAEEFEKQMKFLSENCEVTSLREMSNTLRDKKEYPEKYVSVTFDDTFKNVYDVAFPILKKYNIPATFFITTGMIDTNRMFWVDELEEMINFSKSKKITIQIPRSTTFFIRNNREKISAINAIKLFLKSSPRDIRSKTLEDVKKKSGFLNAARAKNYKNLSSENIREISGTNGYEIGGHTVSHEILSCLSDDDLDREISNCISHLSRITEKKIDLFSYPEGQSNHFNNRVIDNLKRRGIKICPTAIDGVNYSNTDSFHLKRMMVGFMKREFPFKM